VWGRVRLYPAVVCSVCRWSCQKLRLQPWYIYFTLRRRHFTIDAYSQWASESPKNTCERELQTLDLVINVEKSCCLRIGPRNDVNCLPILLYGLKACSIRKTDLDSLDFVVNRFFMKLYHTNNIDTVKECQMFFCFEMPSTLFKKLVEKFQKQYQNHQNTVCQLGLYIILSHS